MLCCCRKAPTNRVLRVPSLLLVALLCAAGPGLAETLVGTDTRLEQGTLRPATDSVLSNASGTLHIEGAVLGQTPVGRSTGASGISLRTGLRPVPVPEPATGLLLVVGASALLAMRRTHAISSPEASSASIRGPLS